MPTTTPRKLTRSRDQRIVAGVLGGVAEYLNMDPTLVRVLFVLLTVMTAGTVGLVAYLVGVLVIPEETIDTGQIPPHAPTTETPVMRYPEEERDLR
ncbi:PspC domain-containing protein [Auraticoccus monumenti]|uniref:Phage shock protein PspC (Stress-responsive transcriptional regulator) n=1 Tax=Auraticoccus monumenti TaxID=675864 RepID=A0A1G6XKX0_9ACTN|nr:PspC domain-containing protein [Auraticoccus monumenti]SDD78790.1 Phage shock protein PspC (stress-responsive transcriptional regulator) [Auraticoccus monumenti]